MNKQSNPFLLFLIGIVIFLTGFYFGGLKKENELLKKKTESKTLGEETTQTPENPLSLENLKKYASELRIDGKKFEECLSKKRYVDWMKKSAEYGREVGVSGTPNFYINGRFLGGAFPIENFKEIIDKELNGEGSNKTTDYSSALQEAAKGGAFNPEPKEIEIRNDTPVRGPKDAVINIVEFSDPSCPFCARAFLTVKQLLAEYKNKIRLAFYYFPGHGTGEEAMRAMLCAGEENKFWEMHDKVFSAQAKAMGLQ